MFNVKLWKLNFKRGRDRLLEYNSCRPIVAQEIVQALEDYDDNTTLPMFVKRFYVINQYRL